MDEVTCPPVMEGHDTTSLFLCFGFVVVIPEPEGFFLFCGRHLFGKYYVLVFFLSDFTSFFVSFFNQCLNFRRRFEVG